MKRAQKFVVSPNWKVLLNDMNIDPARILAYANLPADLFIRENATLTPAEYFRLLAGFEQAAPGIEVPLLLAQSLSVEAFDAPIFACICSENLNSALARLAQYKPLIGPMILDLKVGEVSSQVTIECYGHDGDIPRCLGLVELVFITQLARLATRENIVPLKLELPELPENMAAYEDYFGRRIEQSDKVSLTFSAQDARRPFLTSNLAMWEFFEAKLNQKLADLEVSATMVDRVRAVLLETLPSGDTTIETVTSKLAMSKRTLQRKLTAEAESFQSVLQSVRAELADHYLEKSQLSLSEISFLLGFQESNSFIRAYSSWKGMTPGSYRDQLN